MPVDKEIDEKIKEAARILREDGIAIRQSKILAKLEKAYPDEPEGDPATDDDGNPKPPPKKDEPSGSETERKPKRGWWPDGSLDEPVS